MEKQDIKKRIRIPKKGINNAKKKKTINKRKSKNPSNPLGRPEAYTPMIGAYICRELIKGNTLKSILKNNADLPSEPTVYSWLNKLHPNYSEEFFKCYKDAREIQAEVWADELKDIADDSGKNDSMLKLNRDKLRSENRKWLAAHLKPTKYGDKIQLTGAEGKDLIPATPTKVVIQLIKAEDIKS